MNHPRVLIYVGLGLAVLVCVLIFGGSTISKNLDSIGMSAESPPSRENSKTPVQNILSKTTITSIRIDTGAYVTLTIEPCPENDRLQCFGSGATDPQTRDTVTVFDIVSKECEPSYGVIVRTGATPAYYTISTKVEGTACNDQSNYRDIKRLLLSTPILYTQ